MSGKPTTCILILLIISILVSLAGCGTSSPGQATTPSDAPATAVDASEPTEGPAPTEPAKQEPVILRVGDVRVVDCWNPFTCANFYYWFGLVLGNLMHAGPDDPSCAPIPYHAKTWQVSEDGLTWTFELYEGITYSDGEPFNAYVAKDLLEWWADSVLAYWQPFNLQVDSVEAVDETTFRVTTKVPIATFPSYDHHWLYLIPYHIWSAADPDELWTWENWPVVGSGPYVISDYQQGRHVILDAREDFYLGKPPIDRIVIQYYTNWDAVTQAFIAGEIDVTGFGVPAQYYEALKSAPFATVNEQPGTGSFILSLNSWEGEGGDRHPAIGDIAVRTAIDYAIDKEQMVDLLLLGHGQTCPFAHVCDPPMTGEVNPALAVTPLDIDKANQILTEAGYIDTNGDGIRETPDGDPLVFRLYFDVFFPELSTAADILRDKLSQIGIAVETEAMELGTLNEKLKISHDFDLGMYYADFDIDPLNMDFSYTCWSAESGVGNRSGYCSAEFDEALTAYATTPDREQSVQHLYQAQAIAAAARPLIALASKNGIQAYNHDRFSFPDKLCPSGTASAGVWGFPYILSAEAK